jgi:hypothetical protein
MLAPDAPEARPSLPWVDALVNTLVIARVWAGQSRTECSVGADAELPGR